MGNKFYILGNLAKIKVIHFYFLALLIFYGSRTFIFPEIKRLISNISHTLVVVLEAMYKFSLADLIP
jgi:hypothetical protein